MYWFCSQLNAVNNSETFNGLKITIAHLVLNYQLLIFVQWNFQIHTTQIFILFNKFLSNFGECSGSELSYNFFKSNVNVTSQFDQVNQSIVVQNMYHLFHYIYHFILL